MNGHCPICGDPWKHHARPEHLKADEGCARCECNLNDLWPILDPEYGGEK